MPILNLAVSGTADSTVSARLAAAVADLTREHLRKDPTITAVRVDWTAPEHWFVGGPSLAAQDARSYWLDIKVVDGTNTKSELAIWLAAVFGAVGGILGGVHTESYALVHEVPAAAYGFGGVTQEHRFIAGRLRAAA